MGMPFNSNGSTVAPQPASNAVPNSRSDITHSALANNHLYVRTAKKSRKKKGMKPGAPAANITRGFQTPVDSGGEDSDTSLQSTPRLGPANGTPPSLSSSPSLLPSSLTRAISELKLQEDCLMVDNDLDRRGRDQSQRDYSSPLAKVTSTDDVARTMHADTYDVAPEADFVSSDVKAKPRFGIAIEGGLRHDSPHRKMTASDFEHLKCLGKGTYGTVLLVRQLSTGRLFAQKQLKKATVTVHRRLVEQTRSERAILESVNRHPFVVKLFYAFQDHAKLYLILEYAQGGELFHHLKAERMFSEEVASFYMGQMVLALDHLHRNLGVVYRDLKPENCLLDLNGHLLLTDFGLSKVAVNEDGVPDAQSRCNSVLGTVDYMAPEVVQGRPYDSAVDWWSLGALGFDLLTGAPPFASSNHAKTEQKIVHGKVTMPYYLGPDAKDILLRLLRKEPHKRLGGNMPKDMTTIKSHRFFRRLDWKALERRDLDAPIQPIVTDPAEAENFAAEFTDLAMSPAGSRCELSEKESEMGPNSLEDAFHGFTFVAPNSLLEESLFG